MAPGEQRQDLLRPRRGLEHRRHLGSIIFYRENAGTNPFQAVKDQLDRGGRCTALQIRLNRADNGYNYGIRPIVRTHVYKFWPGDGNTNGNMHEGSWHRGNHR